MGMNNVYYRALHLLHERRSTRTLPARLRMNVLANPGVDKADFELWSHGGLGHQRLRRLPGQPTRPS